MPTVEASIDIAAPPWAVTEILLDIDAAPLWTSGLERLELIAGVAGEPGCVAHAHYVEGSRRYIVEDRLVEAIPNRRFRSRIQGGGLTATVETHLENMRPGTRVTIRWTGTGTNLVSRLVLRLMNRQVRQRMRQDMQALCDLVESRYRGDRIGAG